MIDWRSRLQESKVRGEPLHNGLLNLLRISVAEMEPDQGFPTEREIIEAAGVSRATVRKALDELAREGWVYRRRGSGTFVASQRLEAGLNQVAGFNETAIAAGRIPTTVVLGLDKLPADQEVAEALALDPGDLVYRLERVRLLDGLPAMVEKAYLPLSVVPDLERHDLAGSLYSILREKYGQLPNRGRERVFAVAADRRLAHLLQVETGAPLLASVRNAGTTQGKPIEHTLRHVRPDRCAYLVELDSQSSLVPRSVHDQLQPLETTPPGESLL